LKDKVLPERLQFLPESIPKTIFDRVEHQFFQKKKKNTLILFYSSKVVKGEIVVVVKGNKNAETEDGE
jgi:hypothetical protein